MGKEELPRILISGITFGLLPKALSITTLIEGSMLRNVANRFWPLYIFNSLAETAVTAPV